MKRYKCTVAYSGMNYQGWQSQRNGNTVQEKIEGVLENITGTHINITASGRTDAGVNARGQVFMFDTDLEMSERKWKGALNGHLPEDIHIISVEEADPHLFHARYNVRLKHYDYLINDGEYDVFLRGQACFCPVPLDFEVMKEAAKLLEGTHDFTAFNSTPLSEKPDQVRTVEKIVLKKENDLIRMSFYGKGFLRYQVRMMSAAIMEAGKGKITTKDIVSLLESKSREKAKKNAPAEGLTLVEVEYFEMAALNEHGMVREFILGDEIPGNMTIPELQRRLREKDSPILCMTGRHDQSLKGILYCGKEESYLKDVKDTVLAEELLPEMNAWLLKNGYAILNFEG